MKIRCYTPQLRREVVSRLYHRAKAERIPMTVLANRLIESALDSAPACAVEEIPPPTDPPTKPH